MPRQARPAPLVDQAAYDRHHPALADVKGRPSRLPVTDAVTPPCGSSDEDADDRALVAFARRTPDARRVARSVWLAE
jgi:hypothetical protein